MEVSSSGATVCHLSSVREWWPWPITACHYIAPYHFLSERNPTPSLINNAHFDPPPKRFNSREGSIGAAACTHCGQVPEHSGFYECITVTVLTPRNTSLQLTSLGGLLIPPVHFPITGRCWVKCSRSTLSFLLKPSKRIGHIMSFLGWPKQWNVNRLSCTDKYSCPYWAQHFYSLTSWIIKYMESG